MNFAACAAKFSFFKNPISNLIVFISVYHMVLHLYLGILVRHRGSDKGRTNRVKYRVCNISAIVAWNWHNYIIYYEGIMLEKNEREDNNSTIQYGFRQFGSDTGIFRDNNYGDN